MQNVEEKTKCVMGNAITQGNFFGSNSFLGFRLYYHMKGLCCGSAPLCCGLAPLSLRARSVGELSGMA